MSAAMLIPLGLLAAGAAAKAGSGVAQARALYTDQDAAKLKRLRDRQKAGGLGLTDREQAELENELLSQSGAVRRLNADQADRTAAQLASQGMLSGRDLYLQEMQQQQTQAAIQKQSGDVIRESDKAARKEELATMQRLRDQRAQRKADTISAILGGTASAAAGGGEIALEYAYGKQAEASQEKRSKETSDLIKEFMDQGHSAETATLMADAILGTTSSKLRRSN